MFAWAFVLTLLLIILLRGKFYYTIAAYTMLVVFGGMAWEQWTARPRRWIVLAGPGPDHTATVLYVLPFSLPDLQTRTHGRVWTKNRSNGDWT